MKKSTLAVIIVLTALFIFAAAQIDPTEDHSCETRSFNVSDGSFELYDLIDDIETMPYYNAHNKQTLKWMKSLGDKKAFIAKDCIVIMDESEAQKFPDEPCITDVDVYDHFNGDVIENHDLGEKYQTVYHVKNVKFKGQEIISNGLA